MRAERPARGRHLRRALRRAPRAQLDSHLVLIRALLVLVPVHLRRARLQLERAAGPSTGARAVQAALVQVGVDVLVEDDARRARLAAPVAEARARVVVGRVVRRAAVLVLALAPVDRLVRVERYTRERADGTLPRNGRRVSRMRMMM